MLSITVCHFVFPDGEKVKYKCNNQIILPWQTLIATVLWNYAWIHTDTQKSGDLFSVLKSGMEYSSVCDESAAFSPVLEKGKQSKQCANCFKIQPLFNYTFCFSIPVQERRPTGNDWRQRWSGELCWFCWLKGWKQLKGKTGKRQSMRKGWLG